MVEHGCSALEENIATGDDMQKRRDNDSYPFGIFERKFLEGKLLFFELFGLCMN